jgi:hypothetical protein
MRRRLTVILTLVVIIGLLVILNTVTYVQEETKDDLEVTPNRSTYHSGPTGTRALHDLLNESGYKVIRWREGTSKLLGESGKMVGTFVVIGQTKLPFTEEESKALHEWVARGGRLVLIDRQLEVEREPKAGEWGISARQLDFPGLYDNPSDTSQMTRGVKELQPVQPTLLTSAIESVMPSRFAARMTIAQPRSYKYALRPKVEPESQEDIPDYAPVIHIADQQGAILVDYHYGAGTVVLMSDPYIVTNNGIKLKDNLQLAMNMLTARSGLIAFDEFHQGRGITHNAFSSYFAGTPVLALGAQLALLILLILWTNARRLARPLPLAHVDRRSTLEFVASMAELQERSRAFDLAIENIYTRTRRVLARYAGVDYNSSRSEIAARIAERSNVDRQELETLMRQCEEVINGAPINWRQTLHLVRRLREIEKQLGLRMRSREVRQAAENI